MQIGDNKLVVTTGHNTFHFDLPKDVDKNLKHEITIKNKVWQLLSKYKHENDIHEQWKQ